MTWTQPSSSQSNMMCPVFDGNPVTTRGIHWFGVCGQAFDIFCNVQIGAD